MRGPLLAIALAALLSSCTGSTHQGTLPTPTASPTPTPAPRVGTAALVKEHVCLDYTYRPREVIVACGDGNVRVEDLHWSTWTSTRAAGRGTWQQNDCVPDCARGRFHDYPVRLVMDQPMGSGARRFFGRVIAYFPTTHPPYPAYRTGRAVLLVGGRPV